MRRIQHIHIPKCAGNSVYKAMHGALGGHTTVLDSIALYLAARRLKKCVNEYEFETHHLNVKETMLMFYLSQGWRFISGHLPFSPRGVDIFSCNYDFITTLRHPIKRLESHVAYLIFAQPRTCVEDYFNGNVDPADEAHRILVREEIGEWMARSLCIYLGGLQAEGGANLDNRVEQGIAALDRLTIVGFDDKPEAFATAFKERYGEELVMKNENRMEDVQKDENLRKRVYDALRGDLKPVIEKMCANDLELYEAALEKSRGRGVITHF